MIYRKIIKNFFFFSEGINIKSVYGKMAVKGFGKFFSIPRSCVTAINISPVEKKQKYSLKHASAKTFHEKRSCQNANAKTLIHGLQSSFSLHRIKKTSNY